MMPADAAIGLILTLLLMLIGLVGSVIPGLPGTPLVFVAALGHYFWLGDQSVGVWTLVAMGALMLASLGVDFLATTVGAREMGATRWGMVGAIAGAMVGIFFAPFGLILGPFIGAMALEAIGGRNWRESSRAGIGATLGFLAGTVGRVACCVAMIGLFLVSILLRRPVPTIP